MNDDTSAGQDYQDNGSDTSAEEPESEDNGSDVDAPKLAPGNAYFYNMTNQQVTVIVNNFIANAVNLAAMPSASPYTAPVSTGFNRYSTTQPQAGQFGSANTVLAQLSGMTNINVNIDVNFGSYPVTQDILIYIFYNSFVVAVSSDNNAYLGSNGETIKVDPSNSAQKI